MNPLDFIFEEYAIPTSNCRPEYMTQDSSGSIWFSEVAVSKIGRFFPITGSFSEHTTSVSITIPSVYSRSLQIDSNGYVWFPALDPNKIVRYDPIDDLFTEYSVPSMNSGSFGIAIDRHDNIWFTEIFSNKIGKISSGGIFTEYSVPTPLAGPSGICVSPDGSIWFTEDGLSLPLSDVQKIAKLNPDTGTIVEYQTPSARPSGQANLVNIVSDSTGNIWFVEASNNKICKFSPSNQQFTEYAVPTPYGYPWDIDDDENGNIWFTERIGNKIGQLLQSGIFNEYSVPTAIALPTGIVCTRDGVWFAEEESNKICRLRFAPMPSLSDRAAELAKQVIGAPYHQER
jgi:virginiamycin B lyase